MKYLVFLEEVVIRKINFLDHFKEEIQLEETTVNLYLF